MGGNVATIFVKHNHPTERHFSEAVRQDAQETAQEDYQTKNETFPSQRHLPSNSTSTTPK